MLDIVVFGTNKPHLFTPRLHLDDKQIDFSQVSYPDVFSLMEHLARMGEGTASVNRQYAVGSDTFLAMAAIYQGADLNTTFCMGIFSCILSNHFLM